MSLEPRHAAIVPWLRRADVEELRAASGISPDIAVAYSIAVSRPGWAVELDGKPAAIFGAAPGPDGTGIPWLVATDETERHPVCFYRMSRSIIAGMRRCYDYLENWVDARNTLSLRWLAWAGFTVEDAEPRGVLGLPFHRFWWKH